MQNAVALFEDVWYPSAIISDSAHVCEMRARPTLTSVSKSSISSLTLLTLDLLILSQFFETLSEYLLFLFMYIFF